MFSKCKADIFFLPCRISMDVLLGTCVHTSKKQFPACCDRCLVLIVSGTTEYASIGWRNAVCPGWSYDQLLQCVLLQTSAVNKTWPGRSIMFSVFLNHHHHVPFARVKLSEVFLRLALNITNTRLLDEAVLSLP